MPNTRQDCLEIIGQLEALSQSSDTTENCLAWKQKANHWRDVVRKEGAIITKAEEDQIQKTFSKYCEAYEKERLNA